MFRLHGLGSREFYSPLQPLAFSGVVITKGMNCKGFGLNVNFYAAQACELHFCQQLLYTYRSRNSAIARINKLYFFITRTTE